MRAADVGSAMTPTRPLLVSRAAPARRRPDKPPSISAGDFAEGSISLLVSKRCEMSRTLDTQEHRVARARLCEGQAAGLGPQARGRVPRPGHLGAVRGAGGGRVLEPRRSQGDRGRPDDDPVRRHEAAGRVQEDVRLGAARARRRRPAAQRVPQVRRRRSCRRCSIASTSSRPTRSAARPAQDVYDVLFKDAVTRFAREVALIKASLPKAQLGQAAQGVPGRRQAGRREVPRYRRT